VDDNENLTLPRPGEQRPPRPEEQLPDDQLPDDQLPDDQPTEETHLTDQQPGPAPKPLRRGRIDTVEAGGLRVGRWIRVLAGVDEKLLDKVPQERARYTGLGGVVLGTATIAAFSMWFAITQLLGFSHPLVIVPVLIWFFFILNFDRWLVSSALGSGWRKRVPTLLMRVTMAFLFGVIIAEPIVLRVFQTAIEQHIRDEREQELADLRSKLLECNPLTTTPGGGTAAPGCEGYTLTFETTPGATIEELAARRADAAQLQAVIDTDTKELSRINDLARRECVGDSGPGLTGRFGVGPNCRRLRDEADTYAATHPIAPNLARLTALQTQISQLETKVSTGREDFERTRETQIAERVAELKSHQGNIGLLERMEALNELAKTNAALFLGIWAVRLFFILVDCMPVMVKFLGGTTTYDRLVDDRLASTARVHTRKLSTRYDEADAGARKRRAELDLEVQEHTAGLHMRLDDAVRELANRLERRR